MCATAVGSMWPSTPCWNRWSFRTRPRPRSGEFKNRPDADVGAASRAGSGSRHPCRAACQRRRCLTDQASSAGAGVSGACRAHGHGSRPAVPSQHRHGRAQPFLTSTLGYLVQFLRGAMGVTRANEALREDFSEPLRIEQVVPAFWPTEGGWLAQPLKHHPQTRSPWGRLALAPRARARLTCCAIDTHSTHSVALSLGMQSEELLLPPWPTRSRAMANAAHRCAR